MYKKRVTIPQYYQLSFLWLIFLLSANVRHIRPERLQVFLLPANVRYIRPERLSDYGVSPPKAARYLIYYYYTLQEFLCQSFFFSSGNMKTVSLKIPMQCAMI